MNWRLFLRNTTLHVATAAVPAAAGLIISLPLIMTHPYAALAACAVTMGLIMPFYKAIRRFLQPAVDHFLFADQFAYLQVLGDLPDDLLEFTNLREMLEFTIARLIEVAKLERVRVFMHDPGHQSYVEMEFRGAMRKPVSAPARPAEITDKSPLIRGFKAESRLLTLEDLERAPAFASGGGLTELRDLGGAAAFPISKDEDLLGLVILGPKRSGEAFHSHDLKIMQSLRRRLENFLTQAMVLTQEALNMVKDSHDMKNDVNALKGRISWRAMRLSSWWIDFEKELRLLEEDLNRKALDISVEERQGLLDAVGALKRSSSEYYADTQRALPVEENAITRMAHHLRNWAEFGRVVAEGFRGRRPQENVDVGQMAHLSVDRWKPMAEKKNLQLSVEAPEALIIWGQRSLLGQILDNLIDNAIKATDRGFVRVRCQKDHHDIVIEVADSGCGIAPADLPALFDKPFYHGRTQGRLDQSTGVGLYLAAQYARNLSGRISADSALGKGSTFRVVLPVSHKAAKPSQVTV